MSAPNGPRPSVVVTPWRAVVVAALAGLVIAQVVATVSRSLGWSPPRVSLPTPVLLAALAIVVGVLAWRTRQHVLVRRLPSETQRAVGLLVLGKTSLLAGAALTGGYVGYALAFVGQWSAALPRERVILSAIAAAVSGGLATAGWVLERACLIPPGEDDEPDEPSS